MSFHVYQLLSELEAPVRIPPTLVKGFGFEEASLLRTVDWRVHTTVVTSDLLEWSLRKLSLYPRNKQYPALVMKRPFDTKLLNDIDVSHLKLLLETCEDFTLQTFVRAKLPRLVFRTTWKFPETFSIVRTTNSASSPQPKLSIQSKVRSRSSSQSCPQEEPKQITEAVMKALHGSFYKLQMKFNSISLNLIYDVNAEW